jgi:hypothetical protein
VSDATQLAPSPSLLEQLKPQRFFALWQHVEGYYAFMGFGDDAQIVSYLMVGTNEDVTREIMWEDAHQNARGPECYEIHTLTLAEAFDAARSRPLPIRYPQIGDSYRIGGLVLFEDSSLWPSEFISL